ncbi:hypothetical protein Dimus_034488 [Dionaea muscipula]
MKSDRKPPLVRSPMRIPPRRSLRSNTATPFRSPSGYSRKVMIRATEVKKKEIRPEYCRISCELTALAKMVGEKFGTSTSTSTTTTVSDGNLQDPRAFERGRFYEEYSARRNERLKRKKQDEIMVEPKTAAASSYKLLGLGGVKVESAKDQRETTTKKKKVSAAAYNTVDRSEHPRYALRSINKLPPRPLPINFDGGATTRGAPRN